MSLKINIAILLAFNFFGALSQKKELDHTVYDDWKTLKNLIVSEKGGYAHYQIQPHRGDGFIYLYHTKTKRRDSISRGNNGWIDENELLFVFEITPGFDTLRTLELKEVDQDDWIKDSLGIYFIQKDSLVKFPKIQSYEITKRNSWLAFLSHDNYRDEPKQKKCTLKRKKKQIEFSSDGYLLRVLNAETNELLHINNVEDYYFDSQGNYLVYSTSISNPTKYSLHVLNLINKEENKIADFTEISLGNFSEKKSHLVFLASKDTSEKKQFDLFYWDLEQPEPKLLIDTLRADLPKGLTVSANYEPSISKDNQRIFFGLAKPSEEVKKDTLLKSEKAVLDIWHYKDQQLQPQQLLNRKRDEKKTFLSVLHLKDNSLIQLENDTLSIDLNSDELGNHALGTTNHAYEFSYHWSYPWPSDYYRMNLTSGGAEHIISKIGYEQGLSPTGKYFIFFDEKSKSYQLFDFEIDQWICMTCETEKVVNWQEDINGMPHQAGPFEQLGYTEQEKSFIFHSEFDVWEYDLIGKQLSCLTSKEGERMETILRMRNWNEDSTYINKKETYIHGFVLQDKNERIYTLNENERLNSLELLTDSNHKFQNIQRSTNGKTVVYQKMNVKDYPDAYLADQRFTNELKISNTNPQQSEYIWPTVELIQWTSYEGEQLEGLLYKPDNFDKTKKYPLLVYFYELYSDRKNNHYIPKPTASIIYSTEYASAGYVVFIPDIRYQEGHPAKSAYDCIMSGTDYVLKTNPNIDSTKMGLQGQSWGGYQTAQLVTMTNRFSAAMAGAPVSNMFSAYGGIRWGSGLNRQFQYERTQSRIGKTIWEAPELYIENSPLFHLPNVSTPLLIMHNDNDGAVPWYQGIELYTGLRRLGKKVWMLNYNGDNHNLMQDANRKDLSIRMRQFFDYYLLDKPAPIWIKEGIKATEKGLNYGLELSE